MKSSYLDLPEIINELRRLGESKASGSFFIVSEEQHSATIGLEQGRIVSIRCRLRFGEQAIAMIAKIKRGSCRFESTFSFTRKEDYGSNEEVIRQILQASQDNVSPAPSVNTQPGRQAVRGTLQISSKQRAEIEQLLVVELGPMGGMVMESILDCPNPDAIADTIREEVDEAGLAETLVMRIQGILA